MSRVKVVIADRHPVVLEGLSSVLGLEDDFEIVAFCDDAESCAQAIGIHAPDIAIVGSILPEQLAALSVFTPNLADTSLHLVFFVSSENYDVMSPDVIDRCSVVLRETSREALVRSLRLVAQGERILPQLSTEPFVTRDRAVNPDSVLAVLTDRERQIMRLVSEGLSNKEIGRRLNIAESTIKVHLHHIFQKLEIGNRTELAALAISWNDRLQNDRDPTVKWVESE